MIKSESVFVGVSKTRRKGFSGIKSKYVVGIVRPLLD